MRTMKLLALPFLMVGAVIFGLLVILGLFAGAVYFAMKEQGGEDKDASR